MQTAVSAVSIPTASSQAPGAGKSAGVLRNVIAIIAIAIAAGLLAGVFASNEYKTSSADLVQQTEHSAEHYQSIFTDLVAARYRAMNLAAEVMLQSRVTLDAFAHDKRDDLVRRMEPFFADIHAHHGIAQLSFWKAPATLYYRAGSPDLTGVDLSAYRKTIVAANEQKKRVLAIETGQGGVIALRGVAPVTVDGQHVGVIEFVSAIETTLQRASDTAGMKWAASLKREVSEKVGRRADPAMDAWKGDDVYYLFSDPDTADIVRKAGFDPRGKDFVLAQVGARSVFIKTFPVVNYAGVATITIATVLDLTEPFALALQSAAVKGGVLFLILAVGGSVGFLQFSRIKAGLIAAITRQKAEIVERIAACDEAEGALRQADFVKRRFFTNLIAIIDAPLKTVTAELQSLTPANEAAGVGERLHFVLDETTRLSRAVADFQQIEDFRRGLDAKAAGQASRQASLARAVALTVEEDMAVYRRLPRLTFVVSVADTLPPVAVNAEHLRRALKALLTFPAQRAGQGGIVLAAEMGRDAMVTLTISGTAFEKTGPLNEALLDESQQFLARLSTGESVDDNSALIGLALARTIIEFYGGALTLNPVNAGFAVRLPVTS